MSPRDRGLQPERTALAWQRTAMAAALVAVLLLRSGVSRSAPLEMAAGICAGGVVVLSSVAVRPPGSAASSRRKLIAAASGIVLAGLLTVMQFVVAP